MKRNIQKTIDEYDQLIRKKGGTFGAFYIADYQQLKEIITEKDCNDLWDVIDDSLKAGFMIGYKAGLRAAKQSRGVRT